MAYDLEEQEQLANLKAFWSQYGNLISWVLILVLGSYAGYNFWQRYQAGQASEASALYEQQLAAIAAKDKARIERATADIETKYAHTAYAPIAALAAAKAAFESNDLKTAQVQLQWAMEHGNEEFQSLARLRLSGVLLDQKQYDDALKVLGTGIGAHFAADVAERKGDVLVAQNKIADARSAYQAALDAMDKKAPGRALVQIKLDAIGGAPAKS